MPTLGVNIAVVHSGQILLTRREDFEIWCLPGGHVDAGESMAQAARREAREETGLDVQLERLVGVYSSPGLTGQGLHIVLFAARPVGGALRPQAGEVIDVGYFDPHALPKPLIWGTRQRVLDVLSGVGGGVARSQAMALPFGPGMTRERLYELRDKSGLSRQEFYLRYLAQVGSEHDELEVGGP